MKTVAFVAIFALLGVCFADEPCTLEYRPVCASNGVTYDNNCLFKIAQRKDASLKIINDGPCKVPRSISIDCDCSVDDVDPVCTDRGTFINACFVKCYQLENPDKPVKLLHKGVCKVARNISFDCDCSVDDVDLVCTDRGTFVNSCFIKCYEKENPTKTVTVLHKGACAFPA